MLKNFRSYQLAVQLHRECKQRDLPAYLKDQLLRASSSVALNLSEGSARASRKDRARIYNIALASLREIQSIIDLEDKLQDLSESVDKLGAHIFKLAKNA